MPKMTVDRSIVVKASPEKVFEIVKDLNHWQPWSPWMVMEPETLVNVREDGTFYEWTGKYTGQGQMTVTDSVPNQSVDIDLLFLKPWKSKAKVRLVIKPEGDTVRVHWLMDSSLPFFMFWMKKMMEAFIGMDFERGLTMLKDYVELGHIPATVSFKGIEKWPAVKYIGLKRETTIDALSVGMDEDYTKLMTFMMDGRQENLDGPAFTIYHKWDVVKRTVRYTACVPVKEIPADLPAGCITGSVPEVHVHVIHLKGPYRFIGNLWSTQYSRMRGKAFKSMKAIDPMERYLNSPKNTPELELETEVAFPTR